ncbi:magnesium transporter, partial [Dimargaris cristalligena]
LVPSRTILIGIAVSVVTSFLQSLGLTLQRKSHLLEGARTTPHPRPSYRRPLWLTGFALFVASSFCGTTLTISLLPVIVLAPLGSVTLISNAIFAKAILGDRFSPQAIVATCLVVAGGLLVGAFGTIPLPTHSLEDLLNLYRRPAFITYFSLLELGFFVPQGTSCTQCGSRLALPHLELLCGLLYGILSGMISSQSLLFTKSGIELLLITLLEGDNQFGNPVTWLIVGALVFTALLQLYYLNRGLELCDTLILAPLAFCSYNVSTLFNGLVYYNQFRALQHFQLLLVLVGVLVLSAGV